MHYLSNINLKYLKRYQCVQVHAKGKVVFDYFSSVKILFQIDAPATQMLEFLRLELRRCKFMGKRTSLRGSTAERNQRRNSIVHCSTVCERLSVKCQKAQFLMIALWYRQPVKTQSRSADVFRRRICATHEPAANAKSANVASDDAAKGLLSAPASK